MEAIGSDGIDALLSGLGAKQAEVRFYAAEALAYLSGTLNHTHCREAAATLGQIARDEPAFRVFALRRRCAMQDFAAYEQLRDLLPLPSAETRYGAFRALWAMNRKDPLVKGETFGEAFQYHLLDVGGPPMIHVTYNRLPEIVVFGRDQRLLSPLAINAGNDIMITSFGGDQVAVSKYTIADGDQKRIVSCRVDNVIRAVVELGGGYPDVIQALQEAKRAGACRRGSRSMPCPRPGGRTSARQTTWWRKRARTRGREPGGAACDNAPQPVARSVLQGQGPGPL